jgi:cholesterol oxidase
MEMGLRWTAENLPQTNWILWRWTWRPKLALRGFFNMEPFRHVVILHGCAVGGGSIPYGNSLLIPTDSIWENGTWAGLADWKSEMPAHYATAVHMLGVTNNRVLGPADEILKRAGETIGKGHTFHSTRVAVFEAPEGATQGEPYPDPYFGGEGPNRNTCIGCGGWMMGCRYNA